MLQETTWFKIAGCRSEHFLKRNITNSWYIIHLDLDETSSTRLRQCSKKTIKKTFKPQSPPPQKKNTRNLQETQQEFYQKKTKTKKHHQKKTHTHKKKTSPKKNKTTPINTINTPFLAPSPLAANHLPRIDERQKENPSVDYVVIRPNLLAARSR